MSSEGQVTGNTNLQKQDLSTLDISKLTPLSPEVISRQATINIGTIGHVAHGKSTVVKAISGVHTVRFKNELERNITIKLERFSSDTLLALTTSPQRFREYLANHKPLINPYATPEPIRLNGNKRKHSPVVSPNDSRQTSILDFFGSRAAKQRRIVTTSPPRCVERPKIEPPDRKVEVATTLVREIPQSDDGSSSTSSTVITNLQQLTDLRAKLKIGRTPLAKGNGVTTNETIEEEYTVERVLKLNEIDCQPHFLVKWKGYAHDANTWEPLQHVRDCEPFKRFLLMRNQTYAAEIETIANQLTAASASLPSLDDAEAFRQILEFDEVVLQCDLLLLVLLTASNDTEGKAYAKVFDSAQRAIKLLPVYARRIEQLQDLNRFETIINAKDMSSNLTVENMVDFDGAPQRFEYINDVIAGEGVVIPDDPPIGCECAEGCKYLSPCCGRNSGSEFAYNKQKRIRVPPGTPVFECNKRCQCGPECMNRVVQQGRKHSLCIFKTANGCGWGVRTLRTIYMGQFICEYVGEILTSEETERRGRIYDAEGRTYLFDLDMNSKDNPYTIDAAHYGNVSHFINHSCDPNCGVWAVWIDCLDLDLPRICLFALKRIEAGEELSFDYMNENASVGNSGGQSLKNWMVSGAGAAAASTGETLIQAEATSAVVSVETGNDKAEAPANATMMCRCEAANCRKYVFLR